MTFKDIKKNTARIITCVMLGTMCLPTLTPVVSLASTGGGSGGGTGAGGGGAAVTPGVQVWKKDATILKILPMTFGTDDKAITQMKSDMEDLGRRYLDDWFAIYFPLGDNPTYKVNSHGELIYYNGSWDVYGTTFGNKKSRYITEYRNKTGWTSDAEYFYQITKSATYQSNGSVHTPGGMGTGTLATPIGETMNQKIKKEVLDNKANAKRYVDGYCDVLRIMFGDVQTWDFDLMFRDWIGSNTVSIGFELLQGLYPNGNLDQMYYASTTGVARFCSNTKGLSRTKEGSYLRDTSSTKPRTDLFLNFSETMRPFRGGASQNGKSGFIETLYPSLNGSPVRDFGGWCFYDITEQAKKLNNKIQIQETHNYYLGSETEQAAYGQNGLVKEEDIKTTTPVLLNDEINTSYFTRTLTDKKQLNTPTNGTVFTAQNYKFRIIKTSDKSVIQDWKTIDNTFDVNDFNLQALKDNESIGMVTIELVGSYKANMPDNSKTATMTQNKLTQFYSTLSAFTTKGIHQTVGDDIYTNKNNKSSLITDMGTSTQKSMTINGEFSNSSTASVNNKTITLTLPKSSWDSSTTLAHDTSTLISRASLGDKPVLANFVGNNTETTKYLVSQGFEQGNTGRESSVNTTTITKYLGFIRSKQDQKTMSTQDTFYVTEEWDATNERATIRTYYDISVARKSSVDTKLNVAAQRYVSPSKNPYTESNKDGYIENVVTDTSVDIVKQDDSLVNIFPTVDMQYDTTTGTTGTVAVVGDTKRQIKPISYHTVKANTGNTTVDSTAYASDSRAVLLQKDFENAPVFLRGGGISVVYDKTSLDTTSYVLDIGNTSLKNAWGNSGYDATKIHNNFAGSFSNMEIQGVLNTNDQEFTMKAGSVNLKKTKETQKSYSITVKNGKITSLGGLDTNVAKKMRLYEQIETVLAKNEGTNSWYNESTNVIVVRQFDTTFEVPQFVATDKIPLDFGPESPLDKNDLFNRGVGAYANAKFNFTLTTIQGGKEYKKDMTFRTNKTGKPDFIIPNASVLDGTY